MITRFKIFEEYEDDNYIIIHSKDFESEKKLASGCHICTNIKEWYDMYIKNGCYFFDILDIKKNKRFFGSFGLNMDEDKATHYNIVDEKDVMQIYRLFTNNEWKSSTEYAIYTTEKFTDEYGELIKLIDNILISKIS